MSVAVDDISDVLESCLPSGPFVAFTAMDAVNYSSDELGIFANTILSRGAVWICSWGPACESVHDAIDALRDDYDQKQADTSVIVTTWHDSESLAEALWFAITCAIPAEDYLDACKTVVAIVIHNEEWASEVVHWMSSPAALSREVLRHERE